MKTFLSILLLIAASMLHAAKVDLPGQAEAESSNVVTGTVTAIYSKIVRDARDEWTHCVASMRIESIQKGEGLKTGDLIFVRYIGSQRFIGKGIPEPGPGPHESVPVEGQKRKVCLVKNADGGFDVYYVSGWTPPDGKKP